MNDLSYVPAKDTRFATNEEIANWNRLITNNPDGGTLCQMYEYAQVKSTEGWKPRYLRCGPLAVLILEKTTFMGTFWYIPKGPGVRHAKDFDMFIPLLRDFASGCGVFAVRIEPDFIDDQYKPSLRKVAPIQVNSSTVLTDILPDEEVLLSKFGPSCRAAIRKAQVAGVTVSQVSVSDANCQTMYRLLCASSDGRAKPRSYEYYHTFWNTFSQAGNGALLFAYYDGQVVAACFVTILDKKAAYKDGGSIRQKTVRGASNLLQWEAIKWARAHGAEVYDMYGSTRKSAYLDPAQPYYGITQFKLGFGGVIVDSVGCFDLVIKPMQYRAWVKWGEKVYKKTSKVMMRSYWY